MELNDNDKKLLAFCSEREQSVNKIAEFLNLSPASISVKIDKLREKGLVNITSHGKGKKTMVRTSAKDNTKKYFNEILSILNQRGEVSFEEYALLPGYQPDAFNDPLRRDKTNANFMVLYSGYVERTIRLSESGKKYLKEQISKNK